MGIDIGGFTLGFDTAEDYYEDPDTVESYDDVRRTRPGGQHIREREESWIDAFLQAHGYDGDLDGVSILDVGGGTGWVSRYLAQQGADVDYLDASPTMRDKAEEIHRQIGYGADTYRVGDATDIDHPDNSYDYTISMRVAHVIPEERFAAYVNELGRVARHGALFDAFRHPSLRSCYTRFLPMHSTLRTDDQIRDAIHAADHVASATTHHDFAIPYGAYKDRKTDAAITALHRLDTLLRETTDLASVSVWHLNPR